MLRSRGRRGSHGLAVSGWNVAGEGASFRSVSCGPAVGGVRVGISAPHATRAGRRMTRSAACTALIESRAPGNECGSRPATPLPSRARLRSRRVCTTGPSWTSPAAIAITPTNPGLFMSCSGDAYGHKGDVAREIADQGQAIRRDPGNAEFWHDRGWVLGNVGRYDEALKDDTQAILLNPRDAEMYTDRGFDFAHTNHRDRAIEDYSKAIALDPQYELRLTTTAASPMPRIRRFDRAVADCDRAVALDPTDADAWSRTRLDPPQAGPPRPRRKGLCSGAAAYAGQRPGL